MIRSAAAPACLATAALILAACQPREAGQSAGGAAEPAVDAAADAAAPASAGPTTPAPDLTPDADPDPTPAPAQPTPPIDQPPTTSSETATGVQQPPEVWVKESRNDGG